MGIINQVMGIINQVMGIINRRGSNSPRNALRSSASLLGLAAGGVGWSGLAQAAGEETTSQMMLLPEHYELMENGVVVFKLETGENLSLTADQYLILEDGLLLITDELAQASIYSLPVMGSVRAQLLTDLEQVATIDGTVAEATPAQTLSITEGQAPRLSEQVELQSYELAQKSECEDGSDNDDEGCTLPLGVSSEASGSERLAVGMSVAPGAMALLGMLMTSDQPADEEETPGTSPTPHPNAGTGGDVDDLHSGVDIYTAGGGKPYHLHSMGGKLYFTGWIAGSTSDLALFVYDPEIGVIQLIKDLNPSGGDSISYKHALEELLYFSGNPNDAPTAAWGIYVYNPNMGITTLKQTFSSEPKYLEALDNLFYFSVNGVLHSYDPSADAFNSISSVSSALFLHAMDGKLYFFGGDGLYSYDPSGGSTVKLSPMSLSSITSHEGKLYFNGYDGSSTEMRVYDPTTGLVSDVVGADLHSAATNPSELHALSGKIYFNGRDNTGDFDLWAYDPDSDTSALLGDFIPGSADQPRHLEDLDGILYFGSYYTPAAELFAYFPEDLTV